jgi:hypothetical protein
MLVQWGNKLARALLDAVWRNCHLHDSECLVYSMLSIVKQVLPITH